MKTVNGISVIVCCYNSAVRLPQTLTHLALQNVSDNIKWELIVVDNSSTDSTVVVAKNEWEKHETDIPFIIVNENRQGLSFARKKGVEVARFDILIFCDDDNWLQEDYVSVAYRLMQENSRIGVAGGKSVPSAEINKPFWFDSFKNVYAVGKQLAATGCANDRRYITGAGMIIRKAIFQKLEKAEFSPMLTDRKGNSVSSGGDSEICLLAMQLGYDLYYDERLQFTHYIPANRLKWSYCVEMITKGFAYPPIYYAMYDYCFDVVANNRPAVFEDLFRWNMRKQKRILFNECNSIRKLCSAIAALLYSRPGNDKEIRVKTAINKLRYFKKNRRQLAADFNTILQLAKRIVQMKKDQSSPFAQHPIPSNQNEA